MYSNRANGKAKQLQFKLLHNIVYTKERLQRMGLSLNGSCHFCKEKETLLHLFVHCRFVDSFWIEVFGKFNDFFLRKFNILAEKSEKNICLGIFYKDLKKLQCLLTLFCCLQHILFGKKEMLLNIRKRL